MYHEYFESAKDEDWCKQTIKEIAFRFNVEYRFVPTKANVDPSVAADVERDMQKLCVIVFYPKTAVSKGALKYAEKLHDRIDKIHSYIINVSKKQVQYVEYTYSYSQKKRSFFDGMLDVILLR